VFEPRGERLPFQVLHDEEIDPVLAADVVERADVRVVQRGDRARLAIEAFPELRVRRQRFREDLDRDRAIEPRIAGAIDLL
jgi:hypothetical protein